MRNAVPLFAAALLVFPAMLVAGQSVEHPPLVDPSRTRCEVCHAATVDGESRHVVVEDCSTCHLLSKTDGKWQVSLFEEPPPLCLTCHEDVSAFANGEVEAPHAPVLDDCLTCHDPHASTVAGLLTKASPGLCFDCHDADGLRASHRVSVARSDCSSCHPPHGSKVVGMLVGGAMHAPYEGGDCEACHRRGLSTRSRENASQICFACHDAAPFEGVSVHAVVKRGDCLSCHDPHASPNPSLTRQRGSDLCFSCHRGIAGRLDQAHVHAVVEDSCETCHATHSSGHAHLLTDGVNPLCASCHDLDDAELVARHLRADMHSLDCASCHDAHGSTLPSLMEDASVHPPFADSACDTCHVDGAGGLVADGGRELCVACHGEVEEAIAGAAVPHAALEMAACTDCHSPHASRRPRLVSDGTSVCFACHDDVRAPESGFQHGAITVAGCASCHEAHGGTLPKMTRQEPDTLCLGCHDRAKWESSSDGDRPALLARLGLSADLVAGMPTLSLSPEGIGHPLPGHRALGPVSESERVALRSRLRFDGEMHCLTCHDPHKGTVRELFSAERSDICASCHET